MRGLPALHEIWSFSCSNWLEPSFRPPLNIERINSWRQYVRTSRFDYSPSNAYARLKWVMWRTSLSNSRTASMFAGVSVVAERYSTAIEFCVSLIISALGRCFVAKNRVKSIDAFIALVWAVSRKKSSLVVFVINSFILSYQVWTCLTAERMNIFQCIKKRNILQNVKLINSIGRFDVWPHFAETIGLPLVHHSNCRILHDCLLQTSCRYRMDTRLVVV